MFTTSIILSIIALFIVGLCFILSLSNARIKFGRSYIYTSE